MKAVFAYDGLGRRVGKSVGAQATAYQYDGLNRIAEISAGGTTALLPGALDEYFLRTDGTGSVVPLADDLGSVLGLVNVSGQLSTTYWYDPYGGMSTTGGSANSSTFTGRESDGTGLLFFRARYYNSILGRFISEDPLGTASGDLNFYRYAGGNPLSFTDSLGLARKDAGAGGGVPAGGGPGGPGAPGTPGGPGGPGTPPPCISPQQAQAGALAGISTSLNGFTSLGSFPSPTGGFQVGPWTIGTSGVLVPTTGGSPIAITASNAWDGLGMANNVYNAYAASHGLVDAFNNISGGLNSITGACGAP